MTIEDYKEFQAKLTNVVQPFILFSIETDRQAFRKVIRSTLENLEENRYLPEFTRRDEVFASRLFLEF
jgi:hypothetical protein